MMRDDSFVEKRSHFVGRYEEFGMMSSDVSTEKIVLDAIIFGVRHETFVGTSAREFNSLNKNGQQFIHYDTLYTDPVPEVRIRNDIQMGTP